MSGIVTSAIQRTGGIDFTIAPEDIVDAAWTWGYAQTCVDLVELLAGRVGQVDPATLDVRRLASALVEAKRELDRPEPPLPPHMHYKDARDE